MPMVETDRRRRWAASFMLVAGGIAAPGPGAEAEGLRWNRLLKTALPTDPLRGAFPFELSLSLLDMVMEDERWVDVSRNQSSVVRVVVV
ncbi:hypothetical protein IMZ48_09710 [Candidatus Bathyarchaeota archaeon]|nr:hypothetical protein [Candidatus Bathyarchaeota archaeon]